MTLFLIRPWNKTGFRISILQAGYERGIQSYWKFRDGKKRSRNTHFAASGYNTTSSLLSNQARAFMDGYNCVDCLTCFIQNSRLQNKNFVKAVVGFENGIINKYEFSGVKPGRIAEGKANS